MSTFPSGNFTIINNETGRCVRVRLGDTHDISDHRLGTKYLQSVSEKPTLHLGEPDGSPATAWWYHDAYDSGARKPYNQIASHAIREYQNIGNHCVWLYESPLGSGGPDPMVRLYAISYGLDCLPEDVQKRLWEEIVPEEWKELHGEGASSMEWHYECAGYRALGPNGLVGRTGYGVQKEEYLRAAADAGFEEPPVEEPAGPPEPEPSRTEIDGCGISSSVGASGWVYDGAHIYAADSDKVDAERTYWTDEGGSLVGKSRGGSGQTWTVAPWQAPEPRPDLTPLAVTGLFGPIAAALGG
ncbi:hypothetical protein [Streptomyces sp. CC208A]|uniref:hypothetical protein n=1 Tax=Streptomyces sp. CC208A TaxID=3044573 RepID=UPI0024A7BDFA|nr:hypothetical protein [Streptomyces sp. CC208A]